MADAVDDPDVGASVSVGDLLADRRRAERVIAARDEQERQARIDGPRIGGGGQRLVVTGVPFRVLPQLAGADTTITRADDPSRPNSDGRGTTPPISRAPAVVCWVQSRRRSHSFDHPISPVCSHLVIVELSGSAAKAA